MINILHIIRILHGRKTVHKMEMDMIMGVRIRGKLRLICVSLKRKFVRIIRKMGFVPIEISVSLHMELRNSMEVLFGLQRKHIEQRNAKASGNKAPAVTVSDASSSTMNQKLTKNF